MIGHHLGNQSQQKIQHFGGNISDSTLNTQSSHYNFSKEIQLLLKYPNQNFSNITHSIIYITIALTFFEITNLYESDNYTYKAVILGNSVFIMMILLSSFFNYSKVSIVRTILLKIVSCNGLFWKLKLYFNSQQLQNYQLLVLCFLVIINFIVIFLVDKHLLILDTKLQTNNQRLESYIGEQNSN